MKLNEMVDIRTIVYQWLMKYDHSPSRTEKDDIKIESFVLSVDELALRPGKYLMDKRFYAPPDILVDAHQISIAGFDVSSIKLNWILHTRNLNLIGDGDWTKSMPGIIEAVGGHGAPPELHIQTGTTSNINLLDMFSFNPNTYVSVSFYENTALSGYGQIGSKLAFHLNSNQNGGFVITFSDDHGGYDEEVHNEFEMQDVLIQRGFERFV